MFNQHIIDRKISEIATLLSKGVDLNVYHTLMAFEAYEGLIVNRIHDQAVFTLEAA